MTVRKARGASGEGVTGRIASDSILKGKSNARVFSPEARRSEGERRSGKRDTVRRVGRDTIGDRRQSFQSFPTPHVRTASVRSYP